MRSGKPIASWCYAISEGVLLMPPEINKKKTNSAAQCLHILLHPPVT